MTDNLNLIIFSVDRHFPSMDCDYVTFPVAEDSKGNFSGSYGVKKGHAKAVLSLGKGKIKAYKNQGLIFSAEVDGGFALTESSEVRITADSIKEE